MKNFEIIDTLWIQYIKDNSYIKEIYNHFINEDEKVINDHIALRTINHPKICKEFLAKAFIPLGYKIMDSYHFKNKKLNAIHLENINPMQPKIFISELMLEEFDKDIQETLLEIINNLDSSLLENATNLVLSKRTWNNISYKTYSNLLEKSEYAAWFYVFGFIANHFTVYVNYLEKLNTIPKVNEFIKNKGFKLNTSGGEIKGTSKDLLEQSSTLSGMIEVKFIEGIYKIPCCYYEFAKRYPMKNGLLFQGFIAKSADKIFESTNVKT